MSRTRIEASLGQLDQVRGMLKKYLEDLQPEEWLQQPSGVTNIAWQVGHLAAAQYMLHLGRVRGIQESDEQFISNAFLKRYGRGSSPDPSPEANSTPEELMAALDVVDSHARQELAAMTDEQLDVPMEKPHPVFATRLGAVEYCPIHEATHVGQIVLLRRFIGRQPQW